MQITVTITKNGTVLEEDIDATAKLKAQNKKRKRAFRLKYRDAMKNPNNFPNSHMANRNHPTVVLDKNGDTVIFVSEIQFTLKDVGKDPDIEDDEDSPACPFTDMQGNSVVFPVAARQDGGMFVTERYKVADGAEVQAYYKFTVESPGCVTLDPDIVIEP